MCWLAWRGRKGWKLYGESGKGDHVGLYPVVVDAAHYTDERSTGRSMKDQVHRINVFLLKLIVFLKGTWNSSSIGTELL